MMRKLEILHKARIELRTISKKHHMLVGANSARKITNDIRNTLELLKTNPYLGRECKEYPFSDEGYRCLICGNYLCFYKIYNDKIVVFHIVDERTDCLKLFE